MDRLRFPIGTFHKPEHFNNAEVDNWKKTIEYFPSQVVELTTNLTEKQLAQTYRKDGWNVRQLVHHCADSHMNAFIRFKLCLTEDSPIIKPYKEDLWAKQSDYKQGDIHDSLNIIKGVHRRWTRLLDDMTEDDYTRLYLHPEHGESFSLGQALANYDWHCKHHLAHINLAIK